MSETKPSHLCSSDGTEHTIPDTPLEKADSFLSVYSEQEDTLPSLDDKTETLLEKRVNSPSGTIPKTSNSTHRDKKQENASGTEKTPRKPENASRIPRIQENASRTVDILNKDKPPKTNTMITDNRTVKKSVILRKTKYSSLKILKIPSNSSVEYSGA